MPTDLKTKKAAEMAPAPNGSPEKKQWTEMEVHILEAARHLIADEGYHNFSMRSIAQKSGIHLKSLQYYFRTKQEMLNAVVDYTIEKYYFQPYGELFERKSASTPAQRFTLMLDYLFDDLKNPFTARLFPELWALASHDEDVAKAMDVFYVRHLASLETIIKGINPSLPDRTTAHRAALIGMMIEGLLLVLGHGKPKHAQYDGLRSAALETIFDIVALPARSSAQPKRPMPSAHKTKRIRAKSVKRLDKRTSS